MSIYIYIYYIYVCVFDANTLLSMPSTSYNVMVSNVVTGMCVVTVRGKLWHIVYYSILFLSSSSTGLPI
jgi:hypothetical protein